MVFHLLTDRQSEYLRHVCAGKTRSEIAEAMGVACATIHSFRSSIRNRLGGQPFDDICRTVAADQEPARLFERLAATDAERHRDRIAAWQRQRTAMALRRSGAPYTRIAQQLGTTRQGANYLVRAGLRSWFRRANMPMPAYRRFDELLALIPEEELMPQNLTVSDTPETP